MSGRRQWHLLSPFGTLKTVPEKTPQSLVILQRQLRASSQRTHLQGRAAPLARLPRKDRGPGFPAPLARGAHQLASATRPQRLPRFRLRFPKPRGGGGALPDTSTIGMGTVIKLVGARRHRADWRRALGDRRPVPPPSRRGAAVPYLSSDTLMTPSSLGTITAMFTTS